MARVSSTEFRRMFSSPLPTPMDVPNLLNLAPNGAYRVYGLMVAPLLTMAGATIPWAGQHARAIVGEQRAAKLLVVRYPNHRRFMAMVSNPYYLFANRFREKGVARFEASFTTPVTRARLRAKRPMLVVHFNSDDGAHDAPRRPTLDALGEALRDVGELAYASVETAPMRFLRDLRPNDPNPLVYKEMALFAVGSVAQAAEALTPDVLERVEASCPGAVLQLYEGKEPARMMLRG